MVRYKVPKGTIVKYSPVEWRNLASKCVQLFTHCVTFILTVKLNSPEKAAQFIFLGERAFL